tara:strand:- start:2582 stop:2962 length:381 start_codon:yes stop_codon:yes gene_type:complete
VTFLTPSLLSSYNPRSYLSPSNWSKIIQIDLVQNHPPGQKSSTLLYAVFLCTCKEKIKKEEGSWIVLCYGQGQTANVDKQSNQHKQTGKNLLKREQTFDTYEEKERWQITFKQVSIVQWKSTAQLV